MECYACENEATRQCRRCARVYCELHGGDLCGECLNPASALPSFNLYRGSLLALLVGSAVAIWLLVSPPGPGSGEPEIVLTDITPTAIVTEVSETVTPSTPTPRATPGPRDTPRPSPTVPPAPTDTPEPRTYEVQTGDTLIGIATEFAPPGVDPFDYADQIAAANGLSGDLINPGQTLVLP